MGAPVRKQVVAEATQELQAADVLGVLGTIGATAPAPHGPHMSQPSIAPVGLDLARGAPADAGEDDDDAEEPPPRLALPGARKKLGKTIVLGTIAACALILIAAGVARVGHASGEAPSTATQPATTDNAAATTTAEAPGTTATAAATTGASATQGAARAGAPLDPASTGTIRISHAGHVWVDGKRVSGTSAVVSCGTHQVKVGHARRHSIDVPCGGEVDVSR